MADYITKIRTLDGDKQIDYNALANKPSIGKASLVHSLTLEEGVKELEFSTNLETDFYLKIQVPKYADVTTNGSSIVINAINGSYASNVQLANVHTGWANHAFVMVKRLEDAWFMLKADTTAGFGQASGIANYPTANASKVSKIKLMNTGSGANDIIPAGTSIKIYQ